MTDYLHDVQCLCVSVWGWVMGVGKQLFNCISISRLANEDKDTKETRDRDRELEKDGDGGRETES